MGQEIYESIRAAQAGDREAAGRLVEENAGLIWSVARRYFGRGADPEDLYQLGCVGFLKAIEGYDERYGTKFSTYAVPKISGEIRRFLRDDGAIKVSRSIKEQAGQIRTARTNLEQRIGREPTITELARETGFSPEDIAFAEMATGPAESLQQYSV
jgi:RNA polymerase sporulation-specific sigma factor